MPTERSSLAAMCAKVISFCNWICLAFGCLIAGPFALF
jgi:hypothetical protein